MAYTLWPGRPFHEPRPSDPCSSRGAMRRALLAGAVALILILLPAQLAASLDGIAGLGRGEAVSASLE